MALSGTWYEPSTRPGPAVILVHMLQRSRRDWEMVAARLAAAGVGALTFDLRGHGESQGSVGQNLAAMDQMLSRCEQRFGAGTRITSHFIFGPLTAEQWRKFHLVYTRHHLKQVRKLIG